MITMIFYNVFSLTELRQVDQSVTKQLLFRDFFIHDVHLKVMCYTWS